MADEKPERISLTEIYRALPEHLAQTTVPYDVEAGLASLDTWAAQTERRRRREWHLRSTDMLLSFGHAMTCNGGNPDLTMHHDHEVILVWDDDDNLLCPECGRVQVLEDPA